MESKIYFIWLGFAHEGEEKKTIVREYMYIYFLKISYILLEQISNSNLPKSFYNHPYIMILSKLNLPTIPNSNYILSNIVVGNAFSKIVYLNFYHVNYGSMFRLLNHKSNYYDKFQIFYAISLHAFSLCKLRGPWHMLNTGNGFCKTSASEMKRLNHPRSLGEKSWFLSSEIIWGHSYRNQF